MQRSRRLVPFRLVDIDLAVVRPRIPTVGASDVSLTRNKVISNFRLGCGRERRRAWGLGVRRLSGGWDPCSCVAAVVRVSSANGSARTDFWILTRRGRRRNTEGDSAAHRRAARDDHSTAFSWSRSWGHTEPLWHPSQKCVRPKQKKVEKLQQKRHLNMRKLDPCAGHSSNDGTF